MLNYYKDNQQIYLQINNKQHNKNKKRKKFKQKTKNFNNSMPRLHI